MIHTVFVTADALSSEWQAELLEYSWKRSGQPGELVRLAAKGPRDRVPYHRHARVVVTPSWSPHPYSGDDYPPYNQPASILDWLLGERVDGTVLLLEPGCVFRRQVTTEVTAGRAIATPAPELPKPGKGPFALPRSYDFLHRYCADRDLRIPRVGMPLLIHSRDLRRIAPRWLELMNLLRAEAAAAEREEAFADRLAYAIATAEYGVDHARRALGVGPAAKSSRAPICHYRQPVVDAEGDPVWSPDEYRPWDAPDSAVAPRGIGRELLEMLAEHAAFQARGGEDGLLRTRRRDGIRDAWVLDQMLLDVPGREEPVTLNRSAAAIWQLCGEGLTMPAIAERLESQYDAPRGGLLPDVRSTVELLRQAGVVELYAED